MFEEIAEGRFKDIDLRGVRREHSDPLEPKIGTKEAIENEVLASETRSVIQHALSCEHLAALVDEIDPDEMALTQPFIQHAINAECYRLGIESFTYSEEAMKDHLKTAWSGVKKIFSVNKKVASSVYQWMASDGKGLIKNGLSQVKLIREKRREARDIQLEPGLVIAVEQGAALLPLFQTLVSDAYSDYADHRNDASKALRRLRPGQSLVKGLGSSVSISEGNAALATLDEQTKTLRETLNTVKRRSREARGSQKALATMIRDLDLLSNFLEEIVSFIEVLEKDENNWSDDQSRLERLFDNDDTDIKGAESFIKLASDDSVGSLLRFNTTLIRFVSSTISRAHREMSRQQ